jgi:threonylcarbamoyladenosine tRNA methylthiotransferase MtaB
MTDERHEGTATAEVITLGCRLNAYESEVVRRHAAAAGLEDIVVVNTCAVTAEAVRQARQTVRRVRRERPGARVIVTGCAAQIEPETFVRMHEVDHVIGNQEKLEPETFAALAGQKAAVNRPGTGGAETGGLDMGGLEKVVVNDIMSVTETAGHLIDGLGGRARAYVQVQNGCDHRCTFCIIPFGRGPSRSVAIGAVVAQVRRLVEQGFREVVLTGVDMTSYGADLPGRPKLGKLVGKVLAHVPELERLRLSSIDQVEVDDELMRAIAEEERLMPHLHLSMQAGHDLTLKRMKRRHLRQDAIDFCQEARRLRPEIVFGADLIAGFPTETEEMFQGTLDIVDACGLTYLHVFPYSPRPGTPAARMPQVDRATIKERAARLREKGEARHTAHLAAQVGRTVDVLLEEADIGRTPDFSEVRLSRPGETGDIIRARASSMQGRLLHAEPIC